MSRATFFDRVRTGLLGPTLSQGEVDGCNAILDAATDWPVDWLAYALATVFHETAHTMLPITEYGGAAYFNRRYGPEGLNPAMAKRLGNTEPGDGARYCGRGFVQITGRANYARLGHRVGIDLEGAPERALDPPVASLILRAGMSEGLFTGRKLGDYFDATKSDPLNARRIINGTDKAIEIARYFAQFKAALS